MIFSEIYKIRYLLLIEISLLGIFALFNLFPFLIAIGLLFTAVLFFYFFDNPLASLHFLIYSILIDSFIPTDGYIGNFTLLFVEVGFVLVFSVGMINLLSNQENFSRLPSLTFTWLPFLAWSIIIGLIIAIDKYRVITFWKNYFASFFLFTFAYVNLRNKRQVEWLIITLILFGVFLSLIEFKVLFELGGFTAGIIGLFFKKNLLTLGWGRSNYLSAFFVVIIPLAIGYYLYSKNKRTKILIIFSLILMAFAIILTLSRGGILALFLALILLLTKVLKPRTILPILSVIILITIVLLLNPLTYVLIDGISALDKSGSVYSRLNFYEDTWNAFLRYPITGIGFGNLGQYSTFILPPSEAPSAHNIVLGALGEVGIIGTLFFFAVFYALIRKISFDFKSEDDERLKILRWAFLSSLTGGLLHTLVEPTFEGLQFSIIFWIIAVLSWKLDLLKS